MIGDNELHQKLVAAGYTRENHPDDVCWYSGGNEFEYTNKFLQESVWEAPCGVMRKGEFTHGYACYAGVTWRVENNNYNFHCPYRKQECEFFHPLLKDVNFGGKCSWHMTDKPYDYANSAEKLNDDQRKLTLENLEKRFGHPGMIHCICCHIDEQTCEPYFSFSPEACIHFMRNGCDNEVCYCTGKQRNLQKANIYYDVRVTTEYRKGFIVQPIVKVIKGRRLFDSQKAMTDLELYLQCNPNAAMEKENARSEHLQPLFFAKYYNQRYELQVENVRIEKRSTRDLMQDLMDVRDGITVLHESDIIKSNKARKSQKRKVVLDKKIKKLELKILASGYEGLNAADQHRCQRWINPDRVSELEAERKKSKIVKPRQMELSDFLTS